MADRQIMKIKKVIEASLDKLERMKVPINDYINELKNKYSDDEKKEKTENKQTKLSLLADINHNNMCINGHSLGNSVLDNKKCNQCEMEDTNWICWSCYCFEQQYEPHIYDKTGAKYYYCTKCGLKNAEKVKKIFIANKRKQREIISYYRENPHIFIDLLCGLPNKLSLETLLKEVVVSKYDERLGYCLYLFSIEKCKQFGVDEKLKQIGKMLHKYTTNTETFWTKNGIFIERIWSFRQGGHEFAIVVKGKSGKIKSQKGFYELLKTEINGIGIDICVGLLAYGAWLRKSHCTANNWLKLSYKALNQAKKVCGSKSCSLRIYDGYANKAVESFKDIYYG